MILSVIEKVGMIKVVIGLKQAPYQHSQHSQVAMASTDKNHMVLLPLADHGWSIHNENLTDVEEIVAMARTNNSAFECTDDT